MLSLVRTFYARLTRRRRERLAELQRQTRIDAWQHGQLKARLAFHGNDYERIVLNGECALPLYTFELPPPRQSV